MRKQIKILSSYPIRVYGGVYGPLLTPFKETIENILQLISDKMTVVEVLDDGSEVLLDFFNYDKDNNGKGSNIEEEEGEEIPNPDQGTYDKFKDQHQRDKKKKERQQREKELKEMNEPLEDDDNLLKKK